jgi:hypothetical protein
MPAQVDRECSVTVSQFVDDEPPEFAAHSDWMKKH